MRSEVFASAPSPCHGSVWLNPMPRPGESLTKLDSDRKPREQVTVLGYAVANSKGWLDRRGRVIEGAPLTDQPVWVDGIATLLYVRGANADYGCYPDSSNFISGFGQLSLYGGVEA